MSTRVLDETPKRDTAIFGPHQWCIDNPDHSGRSYCFSSQHDAEMALKLAEYVKASAREELSEDIQKVLP